MGHPAPNRSRSVPFRKLKYLKPTRMPRFVMTESNSQRFLPTGVDALAMPRAAVKSTRVEMTSRTAYSAFQAM